MTEFEKRLKIERGLRETRFALAQLMRETPPAIVDAILDGWLRYGALHMRANDFAGDGLTTYRTLLAARLRVEALENASRR